MTVGHWPSHRARPENSGLLRKLARFGYLTKGALYAAIGVLAVLAALGEGGQVGGHGDVVRTAGHGPFGTVLLVVIGVGLLGYAAWRVVEAVLDVHADGRDGKGLAKRAGYLGSGLMNAAVGVLALDMVIGRGGAGGGGEPGTYVGKLMQEPAGAILLALVGVGFVIAGVQQLASGWTKKFTERLRMQELDYQKRRTVVRTGQVGLMARGVVFGIVGGFLVFAVVTHDPSEARGLGGTLQTIASQPFGTVLLLVVAAGLACYGLYQMVFAKYGRLVGP